MKKLLVILLLFLTKENFARHIAGGEIFYEYQGTNTDNSKVYKVTLRLFRECSSSGPRLEEEIVNLGIYNKSNNSLYTSVRLFLNGGLQVLRLNASVIPCISGDTLVCYQMAIYTGNITVPPSEQGYILSWTRCCRADDLANISISTNVGATYVTFIPGNEVLPNSNAYNNSPQFVVKDTSLVCANNFFRLDFAASDADGDSLSYAFEDAYNGSTSNGGNLPIGTFNPSFLPYTSPNYTGSLPLGSTVTINNSGLISGTAPSQPGRYVVNVVVREWRNGKVINLHRKDFILKVGDCNFTEARLEPIFSCKSYDVYFENLSADPTILKYQWDFGIEGVNSDTSNLPTPTFSFPDTGRYKVTLRVTASSSCTAIDSTIVSVYPGIKAGFTFNSPCVLNPVQFTDTSFVKYGSITKWSWNFGDAGNSINTSPLQNPQHLFSGVGVKPVQLIINTSKGCADTALLPFNVISKPNIILAKDTLKCNPDSITLQVSADGQPTYLWQPNNFIVNNQVKNAIVFPPITTVYTVTANDGGCINTANIQVKVVDSVKLSIMDDTTICTTDAIQFSPISDATTYKWQPTVVFNNDALKQPIGVFNNSTKCYVTASIGSCKKLDSVLVYTTPYPTVYAGEDSTICFATSIQLNGFVQANSFQWLPNTNFGGSTNNSIIVTPQNGITNYILVGNGLGACPKKVYDTVTITLLPKVAAFAGNDTSIVVGQPLQLQATGGNTYNWQPSTGLSNANTANPSVNLSSNIDSIKYSVKVTTINGCIGSDAITIKLYKTAPEIFVPSGFTPNTDGRNDVLRPILVGIKKLHYFQIFNRWGQLVYSTSDAEKGWNGIYKGVKQPTGTYVFSAEGEDYLGKTIHKKGTTVLIR